MTRASAIIVALLGCLAAAPKNAATAPDEQAIQGSWKFVSAMEQGKEYPTPEANRLVITAGQMKIVYPKDDPLGWKYAIDPSKDPREMDWFIEEEPGHPIHQPAIYSLDGETLKICVAPAAKARPTKLESRKGNGSTLWILKRVAAPTTRATSK